MSDILTETQGCELLARLFKSRGYAVKRNLTFREYGVSFHIDGWDAKRRVGFELLTSEDEDHDDLTLAEYQTLMAAQHRGELALFIIDEVEPLSAADLTATVNAFLDEVEAAAAAARRPKKAAPARTPAGSRKAGPKTGRGEAGRAKAGLGKSGLGKSGLGKSGRRGVSPRKKTAKAARRTR